MKYVDCVTLTGNVNACKILVGKPKGKTAFESGRIILKRIFEK
jgi:hypothetical protein